MWIFKAKAESRCLDIANPGQGNKRRNILAKHKYRTMFLQVYPMEAFPQTHLKSTTPGLLGHRLPLMRLINLNSNTDSRSHSYQLDFGSHFQKAQAPPIHFIFSTIQRVRCDDLQLIARHMEAQGGHPACM